MRPIYFVNNYKTRHIMTSQIYMRLKAAKIEAQRLSTVNDGSVIVRMDDQNNKIVWHSTNEAKFFAIECAKMNGDKARLD